MLAAAAAASLLVSSGAQAKPGFAILHAFDAKHDGNDPNDGLIADSSGNLYGTTVEKGKNCCGTVFRLAPSGDETQLYAFKGVAHGDGDGPISGLLADDAGISTEPP